MKEGDFEIKGSGTGGISLKNEMLKITSIFLSVDGEVNPKAQGAWSVFIRFAGCTAGCKYCDTKYSWKGGEDLSVSYILDKVEKIGRGVRKITITGGEPFESYGSSMISLIQKLLLRDYFITIETNGLHDVEDLLQHASRVGKEDNLSFILDWKLPSAGKVSTKVKPVNYMDLPSNCFVKFVISDRLDFINAIKAAGFIRFNSQAKIYFSPCGGGIDASELFNWMKDSICPLWGIGYNLQIHKFIFSDDWRDEEG